MIITFFMIFLSITTLGSLQAYRKTAVRYEMILMISDHYTFNICWMLDYQPLIYLSYYTRSHCDEIQAWCLSISSSSTSIMTGSRYVSSDVVRTPSMISTAKLSSSSSCWGWSISSIYMLESSNRVMYNIKLVFAFLIFSVFIQFNEVRSKSTPSLCNRGPPLVYSSRI
jgi:hypothetical protein